MSEVMFVSHIEGSNNSLFSHFRLTKWKLQVVVTAYAWSLGVADTFQWFHLRSSFQPSELIKLY